MGIFGPLLVGGTVWLGLVCLPGPGALLGAQEKGGSAAEKVVPPRADQESEEKESTSKITREILDDLGDEEKDPILGLVNDIQENMKSIEDLLKRRSTGSETQTLQTKTIEQIEKLIEEAIKAGAT